MKEFKMSKPTILIIDDDDDFRESLAESPILQKKFKILSTGLVKEAIEKIENNKEIACILLDYDLHHHNAHNKINGLELMEYFGNKCPHIPIFMMSGVSEGRGKVAIDSINKYAITFLDKPFPIEKLLNKLDFVIQDSIPNNSKDIQKLFNQNGFVSQSEVMANICNRCYEAAKSDLNIMLVGETGTGKTILAEVIHKLSNRKNHPFKELNCGTMSSDINWLRSEIFGHKAKSFNQAEDRNGYLYDVKNGTLFLDDIIELPIAVQSGLLQVIQSRKYCRLGENIEREFNGRIIAASNLKLKQAVEQKKFREDLMYRLCQEKITIPPLRDRAEDIPIIIHSFLNNQNEHNLKAREIDEEAVTLLKRQPWTGNTRQLLHLVSRVSVHSNKNIISINQIIKELKTEYNLIEENKFDLENACESENIEDCINNLRKNAIIKYLKKNKGNISATANDLGYKHHHNLQYWIKQYEINVNEFR